MSKSRKLGRACLAGAVAAVALSALALQPAAAHKKSFPSPVTIGAVKNPDATITASGSVQAGGGCRSNRGVEQRIIFPGGDLRGQLRADAQGNWTTTLDPAYSGSTFHVKVSRTVLKKSRKHKHTGLAATSPQVVLS